MKKAAAIIIFVLFICLHSLQASAQSVESLSEVFLKKEQNTFEIELQISHAEPFAGAEFALQCPDDVEIKSVHYSKSSSKAGPTKARGFVWFSFFSGSNAFSNLITATVTLEYTGTKNTSIVIDHVDFYVVDNHVVGSKTTSLRKTVAIRRDGANNETQPLEPPAAEAVSTNPSLSKGIQQKTPENPAGISESSTPGTNTSSTSGSPEESVSSENKEESAPAGADNQAGTISEGVEAADNQAVNNQEYDLVRHGYLPLILIFVSIALCLSLVGNFILGYLYIKKGKQED